MARIKLCLCESSDPAFIAQLLTASTPALQTHPSICLAAVMPPLLCQCALHLCVSEHLAHQQDVSRNTHVVSRRGKPLSEPKAYSSDNLQPAANKMQSYCWFFNIEASISHSGCFRNVDAQMQNSAVASHYVSRTYSHTPKQPSCRVAVHYNM